MDKKTTKKYVATGIVKNKVKDKGKNIRFGSITHELLLSFCKKRGYNLGGFCEVAALDKMKSETPIS